jgi:hypothetical protein
MFTSSISMAFSGQASAQAGWRALGEAPEAHIALADDAAIRVILRHAVRAIPGAVAATDAGVGAVQHEACDRFFGIGIDRAARKAGWLQAMVAAHGKVEALGERVSATLDFAYSSPVNRKRIAVLLCAGDFAAAAADTLRHVEVKAVLLTRPRVNRDFALLCPIQQQQRHKSPKCLSWNAFDWTLKSGKLFLTVKVCELTELD